MCPDKDSLASKSLASLSNDFIKQLNSINKITIIPQNKTDWFGGAYSTIKRTLRKVPSDSYPYSTLSPDAQKACADNLWRAIPRIPSMDFDAKMGELIKNISARYALSVGHSQKLISILCKYAFASYNTDKTSLDIEWARFASENSESLLVPIDSIVLHNLFNEKKGLPIQRLTQNYYKIVAENKKAVAWSRLTDINTYWLLQHAIRDLAKDVTPLEFEMRNWWLAK